METIEKSTTTAPLSFKPYGDASLIDIALVAGTTQAESLALAGGQISHVITDAEATAFGIGDFGSLQALAYAQMNAYYPGSNRWCDQAGLHNDVNGYDIYTQVPWPETQCIYTPIKAVISKYSIKPAQVARTSYQNNSDQVASVTEAVTYEAQNAIESNWNQTHSLQVGQSISYGISILGGGAQGSTTFSYTDSFGTGGSDTHTTTLGTSVGLTISLQPLSKCQAWIALLEGTMTVTVTYDVTLRGWLAWHYDKKYRDHWYWGGEINQCLNLCGKATTIQVTQDLVFNFFTDATVVIGPQTPINS